MTIILANSEALSFLTTLGVEWGFFFGQMLSILLMFAALWYFVFKPVIKTADERQRQIEKGLKDAQDAAKSLQNADAQAQEKIKAAALEATELIAKTRLDAEKLIEDAKADSLKKAAEIQKQSAEQIALDRQKMQDSLKLEVAALVIKTTTKLVGDILDEKQKSTLADKAAQTIKEVSK